MPRNETLLEKIQRLQGTRNILLTKGGTLNEGEKRWVEHLEEQLSEYGIFYENGEEIKVA
jgi:hypothetical protein